MQLYLTNYLTQFLKLRVSELRITYVFQCLSMPKYQNTNFTSLISIAEFTQALILSHY